MEPIIDLVDRKKDSLSIKEIRGLLAIPLNPDVFIYLYTALEKRLVDASEVLVQAIDLLNNRNGLFPIAMCLRFGARANMYVDSPSLGKIHILGYTYYSYNQSRPEIPSTVISESNLTFDAVVAMLVASGSSGAYDIFDPKSGKIEEGGFVSRAIPSVQEWINQQGFPNNLPSVRPDLENEDVSFRVEVAVLLDRTDLTKDEELGGNIHQLVIKSHSHAFLKHLSPQKEVTSGDFLVLAKSVDYYNNTAFTFYVDEGYMPSYHLINKILVSMKEANESLIINLYEKMILNLIDRGYPLDRDQLSIIESAGTTVLDRILSAFKVPYWKKACRDKSCCPKQRLKRLALALGLNPTHENKTLCNQINAYAASEPQSLLEAFERRQRLRLNFNMGYANEFMGGASPNLMCANRSILTSQFYEMNDMEISYYRDSMGKVWCFTSTMYENLIKNKINPTTRAELPPSFLTEIKTKFDTLKELGLDPSVSDPITFHEALEELSKPDEISNRDSENIVNSVEEYMKINGFPNIFSKLDTKQMQEALKSLGYVINLEDLTSSHQIITFSRAIHGFLRENPEMIESLINVIKILTR